MRENTHVKRGDGNAPAELGRPYVESLRENWENVLEYYKEHPDHVLFPITVWRDTILQMAVYSKKEQPLKDLLEMIKSFPFSMGHEFASMLKNKHGNTPLHEAVVAGNFHAVKLLVEDYPQLIKFQNDSGETPLFKAASFGATEVIKFLAFHYEEHIVDEEDNNDTRRLSRIHRQRHDSTSVLHVAIQGHHFETAFVLLGLDESLMESKDNRGTTGLHLLASMRSAFRSGFSMGIFDRFVYFCLPAGYDDDDPDVKTEDVWLPPRGKEDIESGQEMKGNGQYMKSNVSKILRKIKLSMCRFFLKGWPVAEKIWGEKKKYGCALRLAKLLIKKDSSWNQATSEVDSTAISIEPTLYYVDDEGQEEIENDGEVKNKDENGGDSRNNEEGIWKKRVRRRDPPAPLFIATSLGIIEIVKAILEQYPQSVEHHNDVGHNILHVAVMYRQKEIFDLVRSKRIPLTRMNLRIDDNGYTLLHQAADNKHYPVGTAPGPALQLQEELQWFERVQNILPSYYAMHRDSIHKMTAMELFQQKHAKQLVAAQAWVKDTSQSCSAVAVLIATVVFAATYTVPGGSNDHGIPIFLHSPYFLFFTIMDVISLACSLTSVVMFLSILTSPFEFEDFHHSIPRKLTLGFTLLFFSVMTTMLAFGATILLTIRLEKQWTTSLISIAAFLPVSVFVLMQFRLYLAFMSSTIDFFMAVRNTLPSFCVPCHWCNLGKS